MPLTVRALKDIIKDWPEVDAAGDPTEVWLENEVGLASEAVSVWLLNRRVDDEGRPFYDMLISKAVESPT